MSARVCFGNYELDVAGMELRKNGLRIRLQEQPFRILATLVDRPGEVVTREDLRQQIWTSNTFIDFDQSLNKAVNRLREVLDDDASQPRFIETIPRRGYRFVAHVTTVPSFPRITAKSEPAVPESANPDRQHGYGRIFGIAGTAFLLSAAIVAMLYSVRTTQQGVPAAPRLLIPDAFSPRLSRDGKPVGTEPLDAE